MKAVICGAGIAGLSLAWWLDHYGWDVTVIERAPALRDEGYMIDFFGSGYDVADLMGLLPRLQQASYPVDEVSYVDRRGKRICGLDYYATGARSLDGRLLSLLRGDLEHALVDALGDRVPIRFGRSVDAAVPVGRQVAVTLTDGTEERADLLVGADGIHSRIRELIFGPERRFLRYLGYHTAAYIITDDALRGRLGDRVAMLTRPGRLAGFYAIDGGRVASFLVHREPEPALPDEPRAALRQVYAGLGWVVDDALDHCPSPPALYYDQVAQIEMPRWSRGRVTLVGDACYAVSLLAGQGASMAMGGAYVLAAELTAAADVPAGLDRYEARLRSVVRRKQVAGRRAAEWIVPTTRRRIALRNMALWLAALPGTGRLLEPVLASGADSVVTRPTGRSAPVGLTAHQP
ncbi:MAG: FAD-dependent oxidoreductase [Pseudonocardiaceae bacterium]